MKQRLVASVLFGAGAVIAAMQASGIPKDKQGWLGLAMVFLTAGYGKFSASDSLLSPNREAWTPERRYVEGLK